MVLTNFMLSGPWNPVNIMWHVSFLARVEEVTPQLCGANVVATSRRLADFDRHFALRVQHQHRF